MANIFGMKFSLLIPILELRRHQIINQRVLSIQSILVFIYILDHIRSLVFSSVQMKVLLVAKILVLGLGSCDELDSHLKPP